MNAATPAEWLTAGGIGAVAFLPGAVLILALDHKPSLAPARAAIEQTALLLALLIALIPTGGRR